MNYRDLIIGIMLCTACACSKPSENESTPPPQSPNLIERIPAPNSLAQSALDTVPLIAIPSASSPSTQSGQDERIQGKVVETMNSGGYTYVSIMTSSGETFWAAGRPTPIKVGDVLDIKKSMEMTNFTSNTLNRTFESIYFVSSFNKSSPFHGKRPASKPQVSTVKNKPLKSKFPTLSAPVSKSNIGTSSPSSSSTGHTQPSKSSSTKITVSKAKGGYTIAEVFAQSSRLAGQDILVRGKVVKFNSGIMDKNWVHIQDGTGEASSRNHDLTITSDQTVSVGETVLVKGKLALNLDIGAGYKYPVIIEQATFTTSSSAP